MTLAIPAWRTAASNGNSCSSRSSRAAHVRRRLVEPALGQPVADHVLGGRERRRRPGRDPGAPRCRRSRARPRGTGPRHRSPRSGPSAGRARCRTPARARGGRRSGASAAGCVAAIADTTSGVEARRRPDGLLEARRGPGDEAVQALLVDDRRDAEPRLLDEVALDRVRGLGHLDRAQVRRSGQAGDLADAVRGERRQSAPASRPDPRTTSNAQNDPSWATFSARVMRASRSATRASTGSAGVAVADANVAVIPSPTRP